MGYYSQVVLAINDGFAPDNIVEELDNLVTDKQGNYKNIKNGYSVWRIEYIKWHCEKIVSAWLESMSDEEYDLEKFGFIRFDDAYEDVIELGEPSEFGIFFEREITIEK